MELKAKLIAFGSRLAAGIAMTLHVVPNRLRNVPMLQLYHMLKRIGRKRALENCSQPKPLWNVLVAVKRKLTHYPSAGTFPATA
jgi:hypothetical protein